ncbi:hypothetical protein MKW98_031053 [Papaver atlanticum]|uniref:Uncharacterized protein n=1 Tax=Papaver atlanticum TaxID=357466 RepID=A0AAD4XJS1_9MAGN|nr:hypothetical protein MKW98_031053 [Papaver atlanticum]
MLTPSQFFHSLFTVVIIFISNLANKFCTVLRGMLYLTDTGPTKKERVTYLMATESITRLILNQRLTGSTITCNPQAVDVLREVHVLIAPTKAAGIGGDLNLGLIVLKTTQGILLLKVKY